MVLCIFRLFLTKQKSKSLTKTRWLSPSPEALILFYGYGESSCHQGYFLSLWFTFTLHITPTHLCLVCFDRRLLLTISTPWGKAVPSQSFLGNRWMIFPHPSPEPADKKTYIHHYKHKIYTCTKKYKLNKIVYFLKIKFLFKLINSLWHLQP